MLMLLLLLSSCEPNNPAAPSYMEIDAIHVYKYPEFDGSTAWDDPLIGATTLPDPYLIVYGNDTLVTEYLNDRSNDTLHYYFSEPLRVSAVEDQCSIQLWDKDDLNWSDTGSEDDLMGGLNFIPWQLEGDETRQIIEIQNARLHFRLSVNYR
jgi:hypothetical protein